MSRKSLGEAGRPCRRVVTLLDEMGSQPPPFAAQLRSLREAAGLTQEELAEKAGLTCYAVSALERGRRQRPRGRGPLPQVRRHRRRALPLHVHHDGLHAGTAGDALRNARQLSGPDVTAHPGKDCADLAKAFPQ